MVAKRESKTELSYEEQVAIARANLERHAAEAEIAIERFEAEHGDPAEALDTFVRETFDHDTLLAVWREWRAERGKPDLDDL